MKEPQRQLSSRPLPIHALISTIDNLGAVAQRKSARWLNSREFAQREVAGSNPVSLLGRHLPMSTERTR